MISLILADHCVDFSVCRLISNSHVFRVHPNRHFSAFSPALASSLSLLGIGSLGGSGSFFATGLPTSICFAFLKGIDLCKIFVLGAFLIKEGGSSIGFHVSSFRTLFAMPVIVSEIRHHSAGQAEPPKLYHRLINMNVCPSISIHDRHWVPVFAFKCCLQ